MTPPIRQCFWSKKVDYDSFLLLVILQILRNLREINGYILKFESFYYNFNLLSLFIIFMFFCIHKLDANIRK